MVISVVVKCCVNSMDSKTGIICEQDLWHIRLCYWLQNLWLTGNLKGTKTDNLKGFKRRVLI